MIPRLDSAYRIAASVLGVHVLTRTPWARSERGAFTGFAGVDCANVPISASAVRPAARRFQGGVSAAIARF